MDRAIETEAGEADDAAHEGEEEELHAPPRAAFDRQLDQVKDDVLRLGARVEQAASVPTISAVVTRRRRRRFMGLILLEALLALVVLIAIVWWTMFSGRPRGELPPQDSEPPDAKK